MITNLFSHGVKILKISTLFSVVTALLLILLISFFAIFPNTVKDTIEKQLSEHSGLDIELSSISLGVEDGYITVELNEVDILPANQDIAVASINQLNWNINLSTLYDNIDMDKIFNNFDITSIAENIYRPSAVYVDVLEVNDEYSYSRDIFSAKDVARLFSSKSLNVLYFIQSLKIDKIIVIGKGNFEIKGVNIVRNESQLLLTISNQDLSFENKLPGLSEVNITATLATNQTDIDKYMTLPIKISNDEMTMYGNFRIISNRDADLIEFEGFIPTMEAIKLVKYIPKKYSELKEYEWLVNALISGEFNNTKVNLSSSFSDSNSLKAKLRTNLENVELSYSPTQETIKNLSANVSTDFVTMKATSGSAVIGGLEITDAVVNISSLGKVDFLVDASASVDSQSDKVIQFIRTMKPGESVNRVLDQFNLSGNVVGTVALQMPANGGIEKLEVDLNVVDNKLTTLGDDLVVENFNSNIYYKDKNVSTSGDGYIRGIRFDILINPSDFYTNENSTFRLKLVNRTSDSEIHLRKQMNKMWLAKFESQTLSGDAVVDLYTGQVPYVEINNLNISSENSIDGDWEISPKDLPSIRLAVSNVSIDNEINAIPDFKVNLESIDDVLTINNLVFEGIGIGDESLSFNGAWYPNGQTSVMASARGEKLSDFLTKLNIKEKVNGGEFDFDVRLYCDCAPWKISYDGIKGIIQLQVKEGVFTDKDPNFGRILSLLNIQSISKRLNLDVSDVIQKGFTYDDIEASIVIQNSQAKITKFELNATSSRIELSGESNIVNKEYNIDARVHPAISDAVPAATYLAGGGLFGLGVWLVDEGIFSGKILDMIFEKVVELRYKITGPWDSPTIELVGINELL